MHFHDLFTLAVFASENFIFFVNVLVKSHIAVIMYNLVMQFQAPSKPNVFFYFSYILMNILEYTIPTHLLAAISSIISALSILLVDRPEQI